MILTSARSILENIDIPIRDARLIISKIKDISYEKVLFFPEEVLLSEEEKTSFFEMLSRYKNHEPVSKIINKKSFWKHDFFVNCDVLDPRPETELVIESVLSSFPKESSLNFLDIGVGSGCILLSLLYEYPNAIGLGIDISEKAIDVAEYNRNILNISNAKFLNIRWNELKALNKKFDVVVSNPPYIKSSDIKSLDENVKNYDPFVSLDGGDDGLNAYKEIAKISKNILSKNGAIFLEVGYDQANDVKNIFLEQDFHDFEIIKDFSKIDRILIIK